MVQVCGKGGDRYLPGWPYSVVVGIGWGASSPDQRHDPDYENTDDTDRYGRVTVRAWGGLHQRLTRVGRWADHPADQRLPIVPGTVIQLVVERLNEDERTA